MEYVTPFNATVLRKADGSLPDWNHVNFVGEVAVDVQVRLLLPVPVSSSSSGMAPTTILGLQ